MTLPERQLSHALAPGPSAARVLVVEDRSALAGRLRATISDEEHERCDRASARLGCGLLRLGASVLTGRSLRDVRLVRDATGRPRIEGVDRAEMDLNISRRPGCAALVVSRGGRCGIDLERVEHAQRHTEIVRALREGGLELPSDADERSVYATWCALEAVLKGDARGLSEGIGAASPMDETGSIWACGEETWRVSAIRTPPGFVGQVAFSGGVHVCDQVTLSEGDRVESSRILCASTIR